MSLYNMLFGINPQTKLLLAAIGLQKHDVERLRNVFVSDDGSMVSVYTRTGGGNRDDYPQETMRSLPGWVDSEDDDFDSTYCTDRVSVGEEWRADVVALNDILSNGIRAEFAQHLKKTLEREPTEADKRHAKYIEEDSTLKRYPHVLQNGWVYVPLSVSGMGKAMEFAESNGGKLRGNALLPLAVICEETDDRRGHVHCGHANWKMDLKFWNACKAQFGSKFPLATAEIEKEVQRYQ